MDLLNRLVPKKERWRLIKAVIHEEWQRRHGLVEQDAKALRVQLGKLGSKRQSLLYKLTDGFISDDDFKSMRNEMDIRAAEIRTTLQGLQSDGFDVDDALDFIEHLLWNTRYEWQMADLQGKQRLQRRLFAEGVILTRSGVRTPITNLIYMLLGDENVGIDEMVRPE